MIIRSRAPLRLSFAGGGTELSPYVDTYGGQVLNSTISLYAYTTLTLSDDGHIYFEATDLKQSLEYKALPVLPIDTTLPLHCGVYNRMVRDYNEGRPLPVQIVTFCEAPIGSGLGASSTLTVSIIKAFAEYLKISLSEHKIARIAFEIERIDLNLNGGHQDQYAAAFGGFNFMDFFPNGEVVVNSLRIKDWVVAELEASLVLYYTGTSRESANIILKQTKRLQSNDPEIIKRFDAMKIGAVKMKECLLKGDLASFSEFLGQSWIQKRGTAEGISNSDINSAYDAAISAGALGGKISGAGGGGFMMFLCDPCKRMQVVQTLEKLGGTVMNCHFVKSGSESWRIQL